MDYESYLAKHEQNMEWQRKGATLSDKTARREFGLTQDEIYDAIEGFLDEPSRRRQRRHHWASSFSMSLMAWELSWYSTAWIPACRAPSTHISESSRNAICAGSTRRRPQVRA